MLILLLYFLVFYPTIISKRSYAHIHQGQSQRFSSEVIFVLLIVIGIMLLDRMLFIVRKVTKNPKEIDELLVRESAG
jgi:cytochrome bd-type quinol oxidase subunit 2